MRFTGDATKVVAGIDVGKANLDVSGECRSCQTALPATDVAIVELMETWHSRAKRWLWPYVSRAQRVRERVGEVTEEWSDPVMCGSPPTG